QHQLTPCGGLVKRVEGRSLIPPFGAADAAVAVDVDDLPAGALSHLAQLALLIGHGLVDCRDPEIENRTFHVKSPACCPEDNHIAYVKSALFPHAKAMIENMRFYDCSEG